MFIVACFTECRPACMGRHGAPDVKLGFGYEHDKCTEEVDDI